jgi:hypothetical protein
MPSWFVQGGHLFKKWLYAAPGLVLILARIDFALHLTGSGRYVWETCFGEGTDRSYSLDSFAGFPLPHGDGPRLMQEADRAAHIDMRKSEKRRA